MAEVKGNVVIGQSGGPTAVINQSLVGVVLEAKRHAGVGKILGARHGIVGIMNEDFLDLGAQTTEALELVAATPSSGLGSCRHKPTKDDCEKVFEVFRKYQVRYFFYIGGNDSAETADIINTIARERDYELRVFHVPKTIDNDLRVNDHCPGYGSAARYVACCFQGNDLDNRALPGVKIDVVMGRNAGWLTAAASLARMDATSGPHLIYVPERPVSLDDMARQIGEVHERLGRCLVAVSEGVRGPNGKVLLDSEAAEKDSHGNVQLSGSGALGDFIAQQVKERLKAKHPKLRLRTDTLGYAQRSFVGCTSEVDAREARMVGEAACKYAMRGDLDGTVAIHRLPGDDYAVEPTLVALKQVARVTREMPDEFLAPSGHDVTPAYVEYARPLVGKLPPVGLLLDQRYKVK